MTKASDRVTARLLGEAFQAEIGYKTRGKPEIGTFRTMTLDEIKALPSGSRQWFLDKNGTARQLKINGQVKVWKRDPYRVEVPIKYGLREYNTFNTYAALDRLLVRLDS